MAIKNLSTLKTQFQNFINRIAPFNTDSLIQKGEHDQVMQDQLDSAVWKKDSSVSVTTAGAMNLDASANDLFIIDTSGDAGAAYTININNLETGQRVRVELTKKVADIITVTGAKWWPVTLSDGSIVQTGKLNLSFEVWAVNGEIRASLLEPTHSGISVDDALSLKVKVIPIGDWDMDVDNFVIIPHLLDGTKIRNINVQILSDSGTGSNLMVTTDFTSPGSAFVSGGYLYSNTNVVLERLNGGWFDSGNYALTPFNRGFITIIYEG